MLVEAHELARAKAGIDHRTTKPTHPWTNGQVERMNQTIKDATVERFHYDDHDQLRHHLADFVSAYNSGRRLKTLEGLTPYEFVSKRWITAPHRFILNPLKQMPGLNIEGARISQKVNKRRTSLSSAIVFQTFDGHITLLNPNYNC